MVRGVGVDEGTERVGVGFGGIGAVGDSEPGG